LGGKALLSATSQRKRRRKTYAEVLIIRPREYAIVYFVEFARRNANPKADVSGAGIGSWKNSALALLMEKILVFPS
jgi:hypothetical protein